MILLDTDICIDLLRNYVKTEQWLAALPSVPVLPGFAVTELLAGCRNLTEVRAVERLNRNMEIAWPSLSACEEMLKIYANLHLKHGIGIIDAFIAATAIGSSATLYTFNLRHYAAIPSLDARRPFAKKQDDF